MTRTKKKICAARGLVASPSWPRALAALARVPQGVPDDFVVRIERTPCYLQCPVYSVSIDAHGHRHLRWRQVSASSEGVSGFDRCSFTRRNCTDLATYRTPICATNIGSSGRRIVLRLSSRIRQGRS